jgi:hypothetical protein
MLMQDIVPMMTNTYGTNAAALVEQLYFSESASIPASSPGRRGLSFLLWS